LKEEKHMDKAIFKHIRLFVAGCIIVSVAAITICSIIITRHAEGRTFDERENLTHNKVGIIIMSSPITLDKKYKEDFDNCIQAAIDIYFNRSFRKNINYIICSGNVRDGYDEPKAMRDSLIARYVLADRIILDYNNGETFNSILNAKSIYNVDSLTIISSKSNNERAIYIGDTYGIHAIGYNVDSSINKRDKLKRMFRECYARLKMFIDILFTAKPLPTYKQPIPDLPATYDNWGRLELKNKVLGHDEQDVIVGNFTGNGIDTLSVICDNYHTDSSGEITAKYYAVSSNPTIPSIGLWGCEIVSPKLVYEGDLDGDGKDEWAYSQTGINSQWRQYRVFTLKDNKWVYLIDSIYDPEFEDGSILDTQEIFRHSGKEIIEKGPVKGFVKVNYGIDRIYLNGERRFCFKDTIVKPTYASISDNP